MERNIKIGLMSLVITMSMVPVLAFASPGIPHQLYGTVKYTNGTNVTSGNVIVKIGVTQVASVPISSGKYGYNPNLLLITDSNSSRAGSTLKFYIGSVDTGTTVVFVNGEYTELNLTTAVLSDTVTGGGSNVSLSSANAGEADMPTGATNIILTNTTVLNLSSGLVGREVTLQSGVSGSPIVLTNSNLNNVSASIPDGTKIQGPVGWDGKITPPISGTPSGGNAPAGFSVGSTVISVGSPDGTLIFDKPVTILLAGVTGTVGYRSSGSNTWVQITNVCGGSYGVPTSPTAPGECSISNGTDTKIVTYHFTTFGSLTANSVSTPNSSSSGLSLAPATLATTLKGDANNDKKVDILDFNTLMINWGKTGSGISGDFNSDGKIDIFDFNLLMINWTK